LIQTFIRDYLKDRRKLVLLLFGIILILFIGTRFRVIFFFMLFAIITGFLTYTFDMTKIMIDPGLVSFFNIFFSYTLGFKYGLLVILIGLIIPEILSGEGIMDPATTGSIYAVTALVSSLFKSFDIVVLGIALSFLQVILMFSLRSRIGVPIFEIVSEDGMECILTIVYFISFANLLLPLFR